MKIIEFVTGEINVFSFLTVLNQMYYLFRLASVKLRARLSDVFSSALCVALIVPSCFLFKWGVKYRFYLCER